MASEARGPRPNSAGGSQGTGSEAHPDTSLAPVEESVREAVYANVKWTPWRPECGGQDGDSGADAWVRAPLPPDQRGLQSSCVAPAEAQSLGAKWRQQVAASEAGSRAAPDPVGLQGRVSGARTMW